MQQLRDSLSFLAEFSPMSVSANSSLQAELARQILALAVDRHWTVGNRVAEQTLARQLGVSRSPVRAALKLLEGRGLLRRDPRRGFIMARVPTSDEQLSGVEPSAVEALYKQLMADRAANKLPQECTEAELAERYDTSRGTLLKALLRLSSDGLAWRLRGHGWGFAESLDDPQAIRESYRFRLIVECSSLREPGFRVNKDELARMREAHMAILKSPTEAIGRDQWFRMNAAFHAMLVEWSGNRFLLHAMNQQNNLRRMMEYAGFHRINAERVQNSCGDHVAIMDALAADDVHFAEALLRRHLERAGPIASGDIKEKD